LSGSAERVTFTAQKPNALTILTDHNGPARKTWIRIMAVSAFVFLVTSWFSVGYNHPDEHFQILEFAALKLGLNDAAHLPWEYQYAMRPAFQPMIVWAIHSVCSLGGFADPFLTAFLTRLLTAAITFLSVLMVVRLYEGTIVNRKLVTPFLLLSFLLFFVVYNGVRFSSDTLSGRFFIIGFAWFFLRNKEDSPNYLLTGVMLGLAFITRYQVIFMIAGFVLWLLVIRRTSFRHLFLLLLGFLIIYGAGILCDRWFYGRWEFTFWNYFRQNLLLDKISGFGVQPWWDYFTQTFLNAVPPFSLIFILAVVGFFFIRPKDPITWSVVPFLLVHFFIGHKELRFLFPIIGFIPVMMILVWDRCIVRLGERLLHNLFIRIFTWGFWIVNFTLVLVIMFRPADDCPPVFRVIMSAPPGPMVLYYDQSDPYQLCYDIGFYRRADLVTRKVDSASLITPLPDTITWFATPGNPEFRSKTMRPEQIYSALPEWTKAFDINGWIERTRFWKVYRINGNQPGSPGIRQGP
jgi:phosphatidylinositol glycan class B